MIYCGLKIRIIKFKGGEDDVTMSPILITYPITFKILDYLKKREKVTYV
jgi:hypothetical protein